MSTHCLEPMTEEEMYALEFSPEELCEEPSAEEPETEYNGIPLPGVPRQRAAICDALPRERRRRDPRAIPVRPLRCDWRSGRLPGGACPAPQESKPIHESAGRVFERPFPILGPGDHHRVQSGVRIEHTASPDAATTSQKRNWK